MQIYLSNDNQNFNPGEETISLQECTPTQDCHCWSLSKYESLRHFWKTLTGN